MKIARVISLYKKMGIWKKISSKQLLSFKESWCRHQMKTFPGYWPLVGGIHRYPVNSTHKGQWRGALMFSLIYGWTNGWVNTRGASDLRRHRAHYNIIVMMFRHIVYLSVWFQTTLFHNAGTNLVFQYCLLLSGWKEWCNWYFRRFY